MAEVIEEYHINDWEECSIGTIGTIKCGKCGEKFIFRELK